MMTHDTKANGSWPGGARVLHLLSGAGLHPFAALLAADAEEWERSERGERPAKQVA